ncbi:MAG: amidohydrolase family protein [Candidatus Eremiobacteraeota bacterium]|nr:amidohydrolase family protein [Candidatus Eremiobacteraeota bacterium]
MTRFPMAALALSVTVLLPSAVRGDADDVQVPNVLSAPSPAAVIAYDQPKIAIAHVRVLDGTGAQPREDQTVLIERGKIAASGPSASTSIPSGATTIDGSGETLIPGLVGTHDHLYFVSGGPLFIVREMPFSFPRLYLGAGVTTIRTAGSVEPYTDLHLDEAIRRGELVGPHMDVTSVYMTGWEPFFVQMGALRSPAEAKASVDFWADRGVSSFKLYTSLPPGIARAVIAEAHARHRKVLAHLCSIGFIEAARMGVDSLEHGLLIDTEFTPGKKPGVCPSDAAAVRRSIAALDVNGPQVRALIRAMLAHHVALSSTLANFEGAVPQPEAVAQRMFDLEDAETVADIKQVREALAKRSATEIADRKAWFDKERAFEVAYLRAGGLLTQGPDPTGYGSTIAGLGDQRDIELMAEAGLTPLEAIRVATLNGAIALGRDRTIGSIARGKNADLVLLRGNPAANIADVENVVTVFKDGVGYDSAKLLASVRGKVGRQ